MNLNADVRVFISFQTGGEELHVELLRVDGLRILQQVEIEPIKGINVFHGDNASGKTSVLEALYMLGRGRSFRGQRAYPLIQRGRKEFHVYSVLQEYGARPRAIGICRSTKGVEIRIDGSPVKRVSILAKAFPFQIVTPRSQEILERGAAFRRRLLDWGVFHVEPEFHTWHLRYRAALQQRNAAIRAGGTHVAVWDRALVSAAAHLEAARDRYITDLSVSLDRYVHRFEGLDCPFHLRFSRGYPNNKTLAEALQESIGEDLRRGYTYYGPHRADFRFVCDSKGDAFDVASGGQKRLLIIALNLAQAEILQSRSQRVPIWLLDDLPAEFDRKNRRSVLEMIAGVSEQVFVTTTDLDALDVEGVSEMKTFHVEQGRLR